ncbi:dTDP-4-amino-4,6-dideoxygalactose transaminase [Tamaricihabitans halophyticus]|uniref:dTDP-4-amino-4,6-dideoxygalactose transaminase n=1 Tax=Tamaricihabitans halophyticus TaxID=1262583 RepID=A0A4R2QMH0_9PSEU|nr:dTDP-4-amino-4,6-dideoxygalactose transaminase [Tamaricihabitans halophyticus]
MPVISEAKAAQSFVVPYSGVSNRLDDTDIAAVTAALAQDTLAIGPCNAEFERRFGAVVGAKHVQATSSCTTALFLAAQALELAEGDEVITTPQTFWVTTWPLQARGCVIRFADIDPNSLTIDPATIEPLITERTKSIWVVHHGGQAADMDPIMEIARRHGLTVVEDCAHVPGGTYRDRRVGAIGDIGCFSFHSLKNMTTGEGGAFVTNNDQYADKARHLGTLHVWGELHERPDPRIGPYRQPEYYRDPHVRRSYTMDYVAGRYLVGNNYRMSELSAALGIAQLDKLDRLNDRRRAIAAELDAGLRDVPGIELQSERSYARHVYHLYTLFYCPDVVGVPKDDFIRRLQEHHGVEIILRYFPIHLLPEFRALGYKYGSCPVAERTYFERQVQLPIYPHLTDDQIQHMIRAVREAVATLGAA